MRLISLTVSCLLSLSVVAVSYLHAEKVPEEGDTLRVKPEDLTIILRETAMPEVGEGRLAKILTRYYNEGLGGAENWEKISSLRVSGRITMKNGEFELNAYQKKPNLIKLSIVSDGLELILAHDGKEAWRKMPGRGKKPEPMPPVEARRFIHSSSFGNHLLYPFARGKEIRYIDTVPVDGHICHHIRVELDSGYHVDYFIDIRNYLEVKVVNHDLENDFQNSVIYRDYTRVSGMPIAQEVESHEYDEWVSSLKIDDIKVNSGVVPFMFKMRP